jgi:nucleoside-diphosphate-sugar epimerase
LAEEEEPRAPLSPSSSSSSRKVVVLGGSGFVGSRVAEVLRGAGAAVVSTSTDGRDGTVALDLTSGDLKGLFAGADAVVSCVGTIGTPNDEAVNAATGRAAMAAKAAGVDRFVYITVSPDVKELASDVEFLAPYLRGKAYSRDAVLQMYGDKATLIEPTFIYGGGSFEVSPPRVPDFYGRLVEGVLSASPLRQLGRALSPGIVKVALEPPVPVGDVARAAAAGALGRAPLSVLDTYDKIKRAADFAG